jgi:hypothetical protein
MKALTLDELKAEFIALNILQYDQSLAMLAKQANKTHVKIYKLAVQIRNLPDKGAAFLKNLLSHPHDQVKIIAAYLLLPLDSKLAISTFKPLVNSEIPMISTDAEMCMAGWKDGTMDVDWFMKKYGPKQK